MSVYAESMVYSAWIRKNIALKNAPFLSVRSILCILLRAACADLLPGRKAGVVGVILQTLSASRAEDAS